MRSSRSLGLSVALALALAGCDSGGDATDSGTGGMDSGRTDGGGGDTDGGGGDTDGGGGTDSGMTMMVDSGTDSGMTVTTDGCELTGYPDLAVERITMDRIVDAVFIAQPPGSTDIYVVERGGAIRIVRGGSIIGSFLNIASTIGALRGGGDERGLHSIAFHPNYEANGRFFVMYTPASPTANIVAEGRRSAGSPDVADPTLTTLLSIPDFASNHNGGQIAFGPDGYLYIGTGDGGGGDDPQLNGQDLNELLGKMLRIDVDSPSGGMPYGIPAGNPFVGMAGRRAEILHYGLRNPWRFAFDSVTASLFIADVGQNAWEEVDVVADDATGLNFGWNTYEGDQMRSGRGISTLVGTHTPPVITYAHNRDSDTGTSDRSITGGYVYRGSAIPGLRGAYLYTDWLTERVWAFRWCDGAVQDPQEITSLHHEIPGATSFGVDRSGELYAASFGLDTVVRIVAR